MTKGWMPIPPDPEPVVDPQPKDSKLKRIFRRLVRAGIVLVIFLLVVFWLLYASAQKEPEFYEAALGLSQPELAREGDDFEKNLLDLQNKARSQQQWQAVFTDSQVNGWLATDLPEKLPNALPPQVSDPRVGFLPDEFRIAFRFDSNRIKGIVQTRANVFCTEQPGQIAIQIKQVGSGFIPIPVNRIADRITSALRRFRIGVEWTEIDSDPVALLNLPPDLVQLGNRRIEIESVQLLEGKIVLTGTSIKIK